MCRIALFIIGFLNLASFAAASELYTHTTAEPEHSYQTAGIYWLPDYLKSNAARTNTDEGGGDVRGECDVYGMVAGCTAPKIATGAVKPKPDLTCYRSCVCPSSYDKTDAICGAGYKAGGTACDGKYNSCVARACSEGGYYDSTQTGKLCSTVTYGGRTCYSCVADPCYGLTDKNPCTYDCQTAYAACPSKCQTCYADNCRKYTAVSTPYGCQTYFADCPSKCQTAYPDNCRNRPDNRTSYGCDKNWADCPSKCEVGKVCSKADCSAYPLTSSPANASSSSCTPGCDDTSIKYKINSCNSGYLLKGGTCLSDTCPSGSKTACNSSQVETGRTTTAYGSLCYSCRAKTCSDVSCSSGQKCNVATLACDSCPAPAPEQGWSSALCAPDMSLVETHIERQTKMDACGMPYYRCCKIPYGANYGDNLFNYGYVVTSSNPTVSGLPTITTLTPSNPSVTITPTGSTATGNGSCYVSAWNTRSEEFSSCGITYKRRCLDLSAENGWFLKGTQDCSGGFGDWDPYEQEDGCRNVYQCCNPTDCRVLDRNFATAYNRFVDLYAKSCPSSSVRKNCEKDEGALVQMATTMLAHCYMSGTDYQAMMRAYNIGAEYVCHFYGC